MIFKHMLLSLAPLERMELDNKRYYKTPDGIFPSVTTVLGQKTDKTAIDQWKARIGIEEAEKITRQAAIRGTAVHSLCENFLMNREIDTRRIMPANLMTFKTIKPILEQNVDLVYGIETPLYSKSLKTAGTSDLLAKYNGLNSIIDFKTSRKEKKEEWILNYFLQATVYSLMAEELTGMQFPQLVIIITNDNYEVQIFIKQQSEYKEKVLELFN